MSVRNKQKIIMGIVGLAGLAVFFRWLIGGNMVALLQPAGVIASQQKHLLVTVLAPMLAVALCVFAALFYFAFKFRANRQSTADYVPNMEGGKLGNFMLWVVPGVLLIIIGVINWQSAHRLDPYRPIKSSVKPLTIQVVALQWKWLFLYPEQGIATVNFVEFPEHTPIHFVLTADAPMNSFWIPRLGSQMYAMTGMSTQLNLMATEEGEFQGQSAEISGAGFAGMKFKAKSVPKKDFDDWTMSIQNREHPLKFSDYQELAKPSENTPPSSYYLGERDLFGKILSQYTKP